MQVRRKHLVVRIIAMLLALILAAAVVKRCLGDIVVQEEKQVEQTLLDVGEQNGAKLRAVMGARNMILSAMCVQMSDESDPTYLIDQFRVLLDIYNVKYIGFADVDGRAYTTDGTWTDASNWEAFRRSMKGESLLTDIQHDGAERINTYSAPVYRAGTGEIMGVMFLTYRTATFSQLLQLGSFDDRGAGCIFQSDGTLVAATENGTLAVGGDLFATLEGVDAANEASVDALRKYVSSKAGGELMLTVSKGGEEYYFHIMELDSRPGWYLATIVPTDVLTRRTRPMLESVQFTVAVVTALLLICGLVYLWTYHVQRRELHRLAYVDEVTGGDNYAAFCQKMHDGKKVSGEGYIVSADVRDFDSINDTCGIRRGNEVIRAMHAVLTAHLERGELSARVTGDRFILFLHSPGQDELVERLGLLRREISAISAQQGVPQLMPKFGVRHVSSPDHPESSYSDINLALRRLSERVDHFYVFFNDEDRSRATETRDLEGRFEKALAEHRFEMWYQPKFAPASGEMVAAEALVRWRKADGKLIPPGKFIPLFERNGMIAQLDEYTFNAVCAQQRFWLDRGRRVVPVSVNISRVSLMYPDLPQRLADIAAANGLPTQYVELEITESAMEGRANIKEVIDQFKQKGFRLQMDDFGSGYSSLSTLTKQYFDNVKIDKSLVDCIGEAEGDALIRSIIGLVHEFNMTVTAEGVEQAEQAKFLLDLDCDNIQGYYYSKPLPSAEFEKLLDQ